MARRSFSFFLTKGGGDHTIDGKLLFFFNPFLKQTFKIEKIRFDQVAVIILMQVTAVPAAKR